MRHSRLACRRISHLYPDFVRGFWVVLLLAGPCAALACQPERAPAYCLLPQRVLQPCVAEFRRRSGPGHGLSWGRGGGPSGHPREWQRFEISWVVGVRRWWTARDQRAGLGPRSPMTPTQTLPPEQGVCSLPRPSRRPGSSIAAGSGAIRGTRCVPADGGKKN